MSAPSRIAVVGASAAGLGTVEALRREGFDGELTLVGDERHAPYDRPPLSKQVLSGAWPEERVRLRDSEAISGLDLDLRLGTRATGVDVHSRKLSLAGDEVLPYDALVVATGVRPRRLPGTEGVDGVHVLRTVDDAVRLRGALAGKPRMVVVGGGFMGAEAAAVACQLGADVTMVTEMQVPLAEVLGDELGSTLAQIHEEHGVHIEPGVVVESVTTESGRATGVRLSDGRVLPADEVLVAIGAIPNVDWLADSDIPVGNGVECDATCAAAPGVWAAGDVASWPHPAFGQRMRIEHRTNAAEQGIAVARNILLGEKGVPFEPVPYIWSDQYDRKIQIYGRPQGAEQVRIVEGGLAERKLVAVYGRQGRVRGAVAINMARAIRPYRALVARAAPWEDVESASGGTR